MSQMISFPECQGNRPPPRIRIETFADDLFQPAPDGRLAHVLPVIDRFGNQVDLVAWFDADPFDWYRARLDAAVLGDKVLQVAELERTPVLCLETPARWHAAADPCAVCVIDWSADPRFIFGDVAAVEFESERLLKRFSQAVWNHSKPSFQIGVSHVARAA